MPNNEVNTNSTINSENISTLITELEKDTLVITSERMQKEALEKAMYDYKNKNNYKSSFFNEESTSLNFKIEDIDDLAYQAQSDINKILKINNIVRYFVNKNDILGKVHEAIETNVNAEYELMFEKHTAEDKEIYEQVKDIIKDFNDKIGLEQLIIESIPLCFNDGNYILYLRKNSKSQTYIVDNFPLGVAEIADYKECGEPYVLINITELTNRLRKIYKKNKKGTPLFYKNIDEEIKACYPPEVYEAYVKREQYAVLDIQNSGVMRINNMGRKYGLSCIFKALKPIIRLENVETSDDKNTLARGKKIIFQKLRKELITDADKLTKITWFDALAHSHSDLLDSLKMNPSVYTGHPWVESIDYVEPTLEQTNVQIKNQYRNEIMSSVGISYLSVEKGTLGSAQVSIAELMKMIDKIGKKLEDILYKWHMGILIDNNIDPIYTPRTKVMDSEKLSSELRNQLVEVLLNKLNCSYQTAYELLGYNFNTELIKRQEENEKEIDKVFFPRVNAFTVSGKTNPSDNTGGRPSDSDNTDKQDYDQEVQKNKNGV